MDGKAVLAKSCRKHSHASAGVIFSFAANDKIIGISHDKTTTFQPWLDFFDEPFIQHIVKVYIGEHRTDNAPLCIVTRYVK
jgi:hypothetical protein